MRKEKLCVTKILNNFSFELNIFITVILYNILVHNNKIYTYFILAYSQLYVYI